MSPFHVSPLVISSTACLPASHRRRRCGCRLPSDGSDIGRLRIKLSPGGRLTQRRGQDQFSAAVELTATSEFDGVFIDPAICVYWRTFSDAQRRQMKDLGYDAGSNALPCVARGSHTSSLSRAVGTLPSLVANSTSRARRGKSLTCTGVLVAPSLTNSNTAQSALEHIQRQRHRAYPGTWAPTLKFLLIEEVHGRSAALASLMAPQTRYRPSIDEELRWLRSNFSGTAGGV